MAVSSQTLEEMFEQLMKPNVEKDAQFDYLRKQLDLAMRNNRKAIQSSCFFSEFEAPEEEAEEKASDSSFGRKKA